MLLIGASGGTRTLNPLEGHGPQPCAYSHSATDAKFRLGVAVSRILKLLKNSPLPSHGVLFPR